LAGKIETSSNNIPISWTIILVLCSIIYLFLFFYHSLVLPHPKDVCEINKTKRENVTFLKAFKSYFEKNGVWIILFFILFYRLGEAFLVKMISPFMLENPEKGGLGLETSQVGLIYGTVGIISMIVGGILGGVIISKFGLKKCLWPMALSLNIPDLFYVYIASFKPSVSIIYPLVAIEQFGYGFGLSAFTVVLLYFSRGKYQTSHYAISTGFMAVGMMFPGMASGFLQELLGYLNFFVFVCFVTIPGMIILFYLPKLDEK
ncbi:MAG: MFS transporter, partial [Elusimicrobiota bacterium]